MRDRVRADGGMDDAVSQREHAPVDGVRDVRGGARRARVPERMDVSPDRKLSSRAASVVGGKIGTVTPERLLAFEAAHPIHSTTKEALIRSELGITPVRYVVLLARAAASVEGMCADPMTARRVPGGGSVTGAHARFATVARERTRIASSMSLSLDLEPLIDAIAVRVAAIVATADTANTEDAVTPVLLRTSEAARMLGIAEQTLRNWRSHGGGPRAVQRGALVRYRPDDVREWAAREFR